MSFLASLLLWTSARFGFVLGAGGMLAGAATKVFWVVAVSFLLLPLAIWSAALERRYQRAKRLSQRSP